MFTGFYKHGVLKVDMNSVLSVISLDAVRTDCILSIDPTFLAASSFIDFETVQVKEGVGLNSETLHRRRRLNPTKKR